MMGDPGVIFADLDSRESADKALSLMYPSLLVQTSADHYHGYWFLSEPVPPTTWEPVAREWSRVVGADMGGWDSTQVLRIPVSRNHKFSPPHKVQPIFFQPRRVYSILDFPESTEPIITTGSIDKVPLPSQDERNYLIKAGIEDDRLPLSARYWLTANAWEIEALGSIDRSKIMWGLEKNLLANGYTVYEVFQLLHHSAINKWRARPEKLWVEVNKAAGGS